MADKLPAVPSWFRDITEHWQRYESFRTINGASRRRQQLERLKESHSFEFSCRTGNPGTHYLTARLASPQTPLNGQLRHDQV